MILLKNFLPDIIGLLILFLAAAAYLSLTGHQVNSPVGIVLPNGNTANIHYEYVVPPGREGAKRIESALMMRAKTLNVDTVRIVSFDYDNSMGKYIVLGRAKFAARPTGAARE